MAQKLIQTQAQKLQQLQKLSAQQMLQVKLLEMPLTELEESINAELDDNPALESENPDDMLSESYDGDSPLEHDADSSNSDSDTDSDDAYEALSEKEERKDELDQALESIGQDDQMPDYSSDKYGNQDTAEYEEMVYGDTTSFYDKLKEQMDMQNLTDKEKEVMEYLIGSLDDDGLLRKDLDSISDELMIYHNIDVTEKEIEHVLHVLQSFDPAGVGGRSLQECLLLQVKRMPKGVLRKTMEEVFTDYFDEFTKKHWDKIKAGLELNDTQLDTLQREIRKLNPKPGASMGETEGRNIQQITPDFIVDTNDDGSITFSLNRGHIPELTISPSFTDMIEQYRNHKDKMSRAEKEALFYAKGKVEGTGIHRGNQAAAAYPHRNHESDYRHPATVLPGWRRSRPETDDSQGCSRKNRIGYQHYIASEQREVCTDQMGHLPTQVLLHRWLYHRGWRGTVNPQDQDCPSGNHSARR